MTMQTRANLQKSSPAQRATEKTMITVPAISDQILVIWKQNFSSDPSETPEEFGQKIEDAYVKLLEENGK